jgi:AraC family transcriptional regulator
LLTSSRSSGGAYILVIACRATDVTSFEIARLNARGVRIADCRFASWEADDYVSVSEPSSIGLSFTGQLCSVSVDGVVSERWVSAGTVGLLGCERLEWLRVRSASRQIEITPEAWLRAEIAEELGVWTDRDLADLSFEADIVIWTIAARFRSAARGGLPLEPIEVEALTRSLYGHVLQTRFGGRIRARGTGRLDARRMRRVRSYVDDNLGEDFGLNELAREAALSPFHFVRAFRRTAGVTPHKYVVMRRAERAHQLLTEDGLSIEEVCEAVGYSSRSHLRAAICRYVGR